MSGRVGRYTLIHRLGQGGVANVFLARRDGSNEACVPKLLRGMLPSIGTVVFIGARALEGLGKGTPHQIGVPLPVVLAF